MASVLVGWLGAGCAIQSDSYRANELRTDPAWPGILAAAQKGLAKSEGNPKWVYGAYYSPLQHTNGIWVVVASGPYPLNKLSSDLELLVRDDGELVSYDSRQPAAR